MARTRSKLVEYIEAERLARLADIEACFIGSYQDTIDGKKVIVKRYKTRYGFNVYAQKIGAGAGHAGRGAE